ncbi:MAG: LUD domain-containing protein [Deltaproteobacteria bacterium]|nr:LUD domain-containing protein [Deltaproteobacteria bacterium]
MEPVNPKDRLIRRVAAALRGHKGPVPAAPPASLPVPAGGANRVARFQELFEAQGGDFLSASALEPLLLALGEALRLSGVATLLFPNDDPAARQVAEALVPFGPFTLASPSELRQPSGRPVAGIQSAEYAVAETGSLVQTSRGGKTLLPGLLADVHVALLSPAAFVDRMDECLAALSDDPPRNISFITGPSRTADIEQTLTIGAHGPRKVIAVVFP